MSWEIYWSSLLIILGLLVGSFLNVCIYRIPLKESIVKGSSHCFGCSQKIKPYDLIPVFSYIFLGGKCRNCKSKISIRYPLIESLNFILYILIYMRFGLTLQTVLYCALASALIVVSMIDIDTGEIPNGLQLFILITSIGMFFIGNNIPWWHRVVGFLAASLILFILTLITNGFGGGDIKLMAVCGVFLGFKNILLALFIGVIIGGILGAITMATRKNKDHEKTMPFGPSLCIGVFTALMFGDQLLNWYLSLIKI